MKDYQFIWHFKEEMASTNDFLKNLNPPKRKNEIIAAFTNFQTQGKGSRQRIWHSAASKNILCSFSLHPLLVKNKNQFLLSSILSLAVMNSLKKLYSLDIKLKYPNDLYLHQKKLGGILIENSFKGQNLYQCILGLGLNINQTVYNSDLKNVTSLALCLKKDLSRLIILRNIINELTYIISLESDELLNLYNQNLLIQEQQFFKQINMQPIKGTIKNIFQDGSYLFMDHNKKLHKFKATELSTNQNVS